LSRSPGCLCSSDEQQFKSNTRPSLPTQKVRTPLHEFHTSLPLYHDTTNLGPAPPAELVPQRATAHFWGGRGPRTSCPGRGSARLGCPARVTSTLEALSPAASSTPPPGGSRAAGGALGRSAGAPSVSLETRVRRKRIPSAEPGAMVADGADARYGAGACCTSLHSCCAASAYGSARVGAPVPCGAPHCGACCMARHACWAASCGDHDGALSDDDIFGGAHRVSHMQFTQGATADNGARCGWWSPCSREGAYVNCHCLPLLLLVPVPVPPPPPPPIPLFPGASRPPGPPAEAWQSCQASSERPPP
jgi:hypothetical protein